MALVINGGIVLKQGISITPSVISDPTLSLGTDVSWTSGTMFDTWTSATSTTSDGANAVTTVWQMFYAHKALKITNGKAGARIATHTGGTNTWYWGYAVSNDYNSQTNFGSISNITALTGTTYVSGGSYTANFNTTINIPAKKYFLIGRISGPFYYAARTLAANRTASIGGVPQFTMINKTWIGGNSSLPFLIPTQLGGLSGTWTETSSISQVAGFLFDVA